MHNRGLPDTYRNALSTFQSTNQGLHSVFTDLIPKGFLAEQLCVVGKSSVIAPLASLIDAKSAIYAALSQLLNEVEPIHPRGSNAPFVASVGPISDVLLKQQSWLSSPAAAPLLNNHLENGDVVLAVNSLDHDQLMHVTRLLLTWQRQCADPRFFIGPRLPLNINSAAATSQLG